MKRMLEAMFIADSRGQEGQVRRSVQSVGTRKTREPQSHAGEAGLRPQSRCSRGDRCPVGPVAAGSWLSLKTVSYGCYNDVASKEWDLSSLAGRALLPGRQGAAWSRRPAG